MSMHYRGARTIFLLIAFMPGMALAAPATFTEFAALLVKYMNATVILLITAAIAIYFWGIARNVNKFGESKESASKMRAYFLWGIIILFVMVSVWGILSILQTSLFGSSGTQSAGVNMGSPFNIGEGVDIGGGFCSGYDGC